MTFIIIATVSLDPPLADYQLSYSRNIMKFQKRNSKFQYFNDLYYYCDSKLGFATGRLPTELLPQYYEIPKTKFQIPILLRPLFKIKSPIRLEFEILRLTFPLSRKCFVGRAGFEPAKT
jgi:hypothetical protein